MVPSVRPSGRSEVVRAGDIKESGALVAGVGDGRRLADGGLNAGFLPAPAVVAICPAVGARPRRPSGCRRRRSPDGPWSNGVPGLLGDRVIAGGRQAAADSTSAMNARHTPLRGLHQNRLHPHLLPTPDQMRRPFKLLRRGSTRTRHLRKPAQGAGAPRRSWWISPRRLVLLPQSSAGRYPHSARRIVPVWTYLDD